MQSLGMPGGVFVTRVEPHAPTPQEPHACTGALLSSAEKFDLHPGSFTEARIWLQGDADGRLIGWPSWWLAGYDKDGGWPYNVEVDLMENIDDRASWHVHWGDAANPHRETGRVGEGSWAGWHTYGVHWRTDGFDFYYDGKPLGGTRDVVATGAHYMVIGNSCAKGEKPAQPYDLKVRWVRSWVPA